MTGKNLYSHVSREIRSADFDRIDNAVEFFKQHAGPADYLRILNKTFIDRYGELWVTPAFAVSHAKQQAVDYAFWNLLALAPVHIRRQLGISARLEQHISFRTHGDYLISPYRLAKFPPYLYLLKVKKIDATFTGFEGFPEPIRKITGLQELSLSYADFKTLPDWIGELTALEKLELNEIPIESIPDSFGKLVNLKSLKIKSTRLKIFPEAIAMLPALTDLDLSDNDLTAIPAASLQCTGLINLNLWNNNLIEIPAGINRLSKLRTLNLSENRNLSVIHPDFALLPELEKANFERCMNLLVKPERKKLNSRQSVFRYQYKLKSSGSLLIDDSTDKGTSWTRQKERKYKSGYQFKNYPHKYRVPEMDEELTGRHSLITGLLKSKDQDDFMAGMRLLIGSGDPVLAEACLSAFPVHEDGHILADEDYRYTAHPTSRLTDILNELRDFPQLMPLSRHSWRQNITHLSLLLDEGRPLPDAAIFPGLRRLTISGDSDRLNLTPQGWHAVRDLKIEDLESYNLGLTGADLPACRIILIENLKIHNELLIEGLPELKSVMIRRSMISAIRIKNCPGLESVFIESNCNFLSVSACRELKYLDLRRYDILRIVLRDCPALTEIFMNEICTHGIRLASENFPALREITFKKIGTPERKTYRTVPDFITQLPALRKLDISYNALESLPEFRADSPLQHLIINGNQFKKLPESLFRFRKLKTLHVGAQTGYSASENSIKTLDPRLGELPHLIEVNILWPELRMRHEAWKIRRTMQAPAYRKNQTFSI